MRGERTSSGHLFVSGGVRAQAKATKGLPIGHGGLAKGRAGSVADHQGANVSIGSGGRAGSARESTGKWQKLRVRWPPRTCASSTHPPARTPNEARSARTARNNTPQRPPAHPWAAVLAAPPRAPRHRADIAGALQSSGQIDACAVHTLAAPAHLIALVDALHLRLACHIGHCHLIALAARGHALSAGEACDNLGQGAHPQHHHCRPLPRRGAAGVGLCAARGRLANEVRLLARAGRARRAGWAAVSRATFVTPPPR